MTAVVYALVNRRRGFVYVGSSRNLHRRMAWWRDVIRDGFHIPLHRRDFEDARGETSPRVARAARGTSPDEWSFEVWSRLPRDCSEDELWAAELGWMCQAREYCGPDCLNGTGSGAFVPRRSFRRGVFQDGGSGDVCSS